MWTWIFQGITGRLDDHDRKRLRHGLGWWAPEMRLHWVRAWLALTRGTENFFGHALTNAARLEAAHRAAASR